MVRANAKTEKFDLIKLAGHLVLYSNLRVDRSTVPEELFVYDIRHADEDWGYAAELKSSVLVNHMATILSDHEILLPDFGDTLVLDNNLEFLDVSLTLDEYQKYQMIVEPEINQQLT